MHQVRVLTEEIIHSVNLKPGRGFALNRNPPVYLCLRSSEAAAKLKNHLMHIDIYIYILIISILMREQDRLIKSYEMSGREQEGANCSTTSIHFLRRFKLGLLVFPRTQNPDFTLLDGVKL